MKITKVLSILLLASSCFSTEIDDGSVYSKNSVRLKFEHGTFTVESKDGVFDIPQYNVRGIVSGLKKDVIEDLLSKRSLYFSLDSNNEILDSHLRLYGGMQPEKSNTLLSEIKFIGKAAIGGAITGGTIGSVVIPVIGWVPGAIGGAFAGVGGALMGRGESTKDSFSKK